MSDHEHKGGCDCGGGNCEHEEEFDTVILTDDSGEEHEFVHLDTIELDGNTYLVLMPIVEDENDEEADEAIILKLGKDDEGNEVLLDIEDDEEWEKVADAWESLDQE
ncbi:MAG TPA: DUF1292 domain-containing protein [Candidatus Deferrimicrobium sp.]|nr:DUF1292 domain-containing protein [Candidatus Deferrimicrobium sp.]